MEEKKELNSDNSINEKRDIYQNSIIVIPKKISKITQNSLRNIYLYSMNAQEQEKIDLLQIDENKHKRAMECIKYIDGVGYVGVSFRVVRKINSDDDVDLYTLVLEPELNVNKARKKIEKFLKQYNR